MSELFNYILISSVAFLLLATISLIFKGKGIISTVLSSISVVLLIIVLVSLWLHLSRPPLKTLGETRLWYALFLNLLGVILWLRWKYKWLLAYSNLMAVLFIVIDLVKPATMDQTLMPALQSVWFVPHVIVYILAYALLGMSAIFAGWIILNPSMHIDKKRKVLINADNLVYIGFSFLTLGLVFGALWAKEAWGHYWTWDPKETWAFITWMTYLIYIHFRYKKSSTPNTAAWILALSFAFLLICWMGVNYLPSASNSVHTY